MASLLALDLGTTTGYKVGYAKSAVSGTFDLRPSRWEGGGMRGVKFRTKLNEMHAAFTITRVVYEEVHRHRGTDAAHIYGGLLMILTSWCEENSIPYEGVGVGTIKKFWTGKGNADKAAMIAEAERRGFSPSDDNEADAIALFEMKVADLVVWSPSEDPPVSTIAATGPPAVKFDAEGWLADFDAHWQKLEPA
jgi:crossover junction endodeoxyribonuclease RuvC